MKSKESSKIQSAYVVTGPGLVRVYQESLDKQKDIGLVLEHDGKGRIKRIGYRLKDKERAEFPKETNWFEKGEVEILVNPIELEKGTGEIGYELDVDIAFSPPKRLDEKGRELLLYFPNGGTRFRNIIRFNKNKILEFVVQLEINVKRSEVEEWRPAVRYDCAHGYIHKDLIYANGKREKVRVETQVLKDAITFVINDMKSNLEYWFKSLGYNKMSMTVFSWSTLDVDLEDAEKFLLSLIENPERIPQTSSVHRIVGIEKFKREKRLEAVHKPDV
jgi:hypothetical protein